MTAIFKVSYTGTLQPPQIGPSDLVATVSAANTTWGWLGGLDGISRIFKLSGNRLATLNIFSPAPTLPSCCHILTFEGVYEFEDFASEAFDGDSTVQIVGFTICALSHELQLEKAIQLFMGNLVPSLLGQDPASFPGLVEALHTQLLDNGKKIINHGATRGLPERFCRALENSNISMGRVEPVVYWKGWRSELYMVAGLLKWIGKGVRETYFTRSAVVARTALYLKEVGYLIGTIRTWNGEGQRPETLRGVVLVTGGARSIDQDDLITDQYVDDDEGPLKYPNPNFISHYRFSTVGAMLVSTLQAMPENPQELFQEYFDSIRSDISQSLAFRWEYTAEDREAQEFDKEVSAIPIWHPSNARSSSSALRLSSIYFGQAAVVLAPYYERIASPDAVRKILAEIDRDDRTVGQNGHLVRFRVVTFSILLAIVERIAGSNFESLHHATATSLHQPKVLRNCCTEVEKLIKTGLSFTRLATLIAYFHCGTQPPRGPENVQDEEVSYVDTAIIGWRNGRHSVLPALLFSMNLGPSSAALGFTCADSFIGNIPVYGDGSVRTNKHESLANSFRDSMLLQSLMTQKNNGNKGTQLVQASHDISLGIPRPGLPDVPLHLTIERPLNRSDPDLGLCGRVNGEVIGNVGIIAVLRNLIQSNCGESSSNRSQSNGTTPCGSLHPDTQSFFNVPPSVWARSHRKPIGDPHYHTYIPVQDDAAWAIFLSGEADSRIILQGCARCISEMHQGEDKLLFVGYKG